MEVLLETPADFLIPHSLKLFRRWVADQLVKLGQFKCHCDGDHMCLEVKMCPNVFRVYYIQKSQLRTNDLTLAIVQTLLTHMWRQPT